MNFIAARDIGNGHFEYIGSNIKADKENWIGKDMKKGTYYAMIKTPWRSFVNEFSFSVYGPDKTEF